MEIRNWLVLLKNKSLNLLDQVLTVLLTCIILMELNYLQDYELGQVICVNTNLGIIFKTPKTHFRNCGRHIEISTSFSTAQITQIKKKTLFDKISNIKRSLLNQNDSIIVETFFFVSIGFGDEENTLIIESIIEYIITTERFIAPVL